MLSLAQYLDDRLAHGRSYFSREEAFTALGIASRNFAQVAQDIGDKADSAKLATIAAAYENSSVRRLGFLLDWAGRERQARALEPFVRKAKTVAPLNPAAKPLVASLAESSEKNSKWKLPINEPVEIDS